MYCLLVLNTFLTLENANYHAILIDAPYLAF